MAGRKKVTMADISRLAGVSQPAVSMILSGRKNMRFAQATIERVRQAASELGYARPQAARAALPGPGTILVLCPNISNHYYSTIAQAIQQAADAHTFTCLIMTTYRSREKEEQCLRMAQAMEVSGVIFTMMPGNIAMVEEMTASIPTVIICDQDNTSSVDSRVDSRVDSIELDNFKAGTLLGQHLADLGHRKIAFISTTLNQCNRMRQRRLEGVQAVFARLAGASVQVISRDITPEEELADIAVEYHTGRALTATCLERWPECTALVAVNDSVAFGVLDALAVRGLKVPDDYSVCGFDNLAVSRLMAIDLTTVEHHIEDKGRNAFEMLYSRIIKTGVNSCAGMYRTRMEFGHMLRTGRTTGPCPVRQPQSVQAAHEPVHEPANDPARDPASAPEPAREAESQAAAVERKPV